MGNGMLSRQMGRWQYQMPWGGREPGLLDRIMGRRPAAGPGDVLTDLRERFGMGREEMTVAGMPLGTAAAIGAAAVASAVVLPKVMGWGVRQMPMGTMAPPRAMSVAEVMTRDVVTAPPSATVRELAQLMERHNVGTVVIAEEGRLRGLVTDRQLATHCLARGMNPDTCRADEVMTAEMPGPGGVVTAHPHMDLLEAARLMGRHRIRRLPVVEDGRVVGILSVADLAGEVKDMVSAVMDEISHTER